MAADQSQQGISIKAVLAATGLSLFAWTIYGFVSILILSKVTGLNDGPSLRAYIEGSFAAKAFVIIASVALNAGIGFFAAVIAKRREVLHGALSAMLYVTMVIYGLAAGFAPEAASRNLLGILLAPLAGALGGWLRLRRRRAAPGESSR